MPLLPYGNDAGYIGRLADHYILVYEKDRSLSIFVLN